MRFIQFALVFICLCLFILSCQHEDAVIPTDEVDNSNPHGYKTTYIPPTAQRIGDANRGYDYLVNGDYVSSGVPIDIFTNVFGSDNNNYLNRTGDNASIPPEYTAIDAPNGTRIVVAQCLQCHGQTLNGEYYVGLGNAVADFTNDPSSQFVLLDNVIKGAYGENSDEWRAYEPLSKAGHAIGDQIQVPVRGTNPADMLTLILGGHRNQHTLEWLEDAQFPIPDLPKTPTDIPPWWLMKKKNAMFYTAVGRGDFPRIMMSSALLTMKDSAQARAIDQRFEDVAAYIYSIEAPEYPEVIDAPLAMQGKTIFEAECSYCHGTYGDNETYPNLLVDLETIGTDTMVATANFAVSDFIEWYNDSWFTKGDGRSWFELNLGYVAQPLDGIWASAPYLHNGSVPTLYHLLKSSERPDIWARTFETDDIDYEKVGWNHEVRSSGGSSNVYDTNLPGHGNQGHTFGDDLSEDDRMAVIEYLKTL